MTNEKPILFKPEMVRAVISGIKKQTRRTSGLDAINEDPSEWELEGRILCSGNKKDVGKYSFMNNESGECAYVKCPYGEVGSKLWVREPWQYYNWTEDGEPWIRYAADNAGLLRQPTEDWSERVMDIWEKLSRNDNYKIDSRARDRQWRSPRFMPRWASRLWLEVVEIQAQRLQDITEADAMAEGVTIHLDAVMAGAVAQDTPARMEFWSLWNSIHSKDGLGWERNPFVWVVTFKQFVHPTWKVEYGEMEEVKG